MLHCLSCQKRFLWAHKAADLAPHPVVGLVLQVGDAEVSSGTWSRKLGSFSQSQQEGSMSPSHRVCTDTPNVEWTLSLIHI